MSLHKEIRFEDEICEELLTGAWLFEPGVSVPYDRHRALFSRGHAGVSATTQPAAWQALEKNFGGKALDVLLDRLRDQLNTRGTLEVLRNGMASTPSEACWPWRSSSRPAA